MVDDKAKYLPHCNCGRAIKTAAHEFELQRSNLKPRRMNSNCGALTLSAKNRDSDSNNSQDNAGDAHDSSPTCGDAAIIRPFPPSGMDMTPLATPIMGCPVKVKKKLRIALMIEATATLPVFCSVASC